MGLIYRRAMADFSARSARRPPLSVKCGRRFEDNEGSFTLPTSSIWGPTKENCIGMCQEKCAASRNFKWNFALEAIHTWRKGRPRTQCPRLQGLQTRHPEETSRIISLYKY